MTAGSVAGPYRERARRSGLVEAAGFGYGTLEPPIAPHLNATWLD